MQIGILDSIFQHFTEKIEEISCPENFKCPKDLIVFKIDISHPKNVN